MTGRRRVPGDVLVPLRRARDHLDRHYADEFDLDLLAGLAGLAATTSSGRSRRPSGPLPRPTSPTVGSSVALMRDNSGNWMVLVEPRAYSPEDFEGVDLG